MIDFTKVKPGDRFRVIITLTTQDKVGEEVTVGDKIDRVGFVSADGWRYVWLQAELITEPALTTSPIEGMPDWLASTKKGEAVKCRVKTYIGQDYRPEPRWIVGRYYVAEVGAEVFIDTQKEAHFYAEPWAEPEAESSLFTPEQLAELDARYGRDL